VAERERNIKENTRGRRDSPKKNTARKKNSAMERQIGSTRGKPEKKKKK